MELLQPHGLPLYVPYKAQPADADFICAGEEAHFVVTSSTDDHFAMAKFEQGSVFVIKGNMKDMQGARGCHNKTYSNQEAVFTMPEHEQGMGIPTQYLPKYPACGGLIQIHLPENQAFVRDPARQAQSKSYMGVIDRFHNKNLLILEFGVGVRSQMITAPFMSCQFRSRIIGPSGKSQISSHLT